KGSHRFVSVESVEERETLVEEFLGFGTLGCDGMMPGTESLHERDRFFGWWRGRMMLGEEHQREKVERQLHVPIITLQQTWRRRFCRRRVDCVSKRQAARPPAPRRELCHPERFRWISLPAMSVGLK